MSSFAFPRDLLAEVLGLSSESESISFPLRFEILQLHGRVFAIGVHLLVIEPEAHRLCRAFSIDVAAWAVASTSFSRGHCINHIADEPLGVGGVI